MKIKLSCIKIDWQGERMKDKIIILGVPFSKMSMKETIDEIENRVKGNNEELFKIITGNPEIVLSAQKDNEVKRILEEAEMITADGVGIILAAKWKKQPLPERVTGIDLLLEALNRGSKEEWSFYFFGSSEEVNQKAVENIMVKYPGVKIAGRHNGYFDPAEEGKILEDIQRAKPDLLIVALGAPRSEIWINKNKAILNAKVAFGVGGSLDVISGKVKRAPQIWQKLKIEWLYRLLIQPSRIKRQTALPVFACKSLIEALKGR